MPSLEGSELFKHTIGPREGAKIVIVGEAWGEQEAKVGLPFQGRSGELLRDVCFEAGLRFGDILCTNVFNLRPKDNNLENILTDKKSGVPGYPPVNKGKYLPHELLPHLERLWQQIRTVRPNLTIATGATAAWALLGVSGISGVRGYVAPGLYTGGKVLPTFHPALVLRQWANRPVLLADLLKAKREAEFPEIRRKSRLVLVNPTIQEVLEWYEAHRLAPRLSVDIETKGGQIAMIGFADGTTSAMVVPFHNPEAPDYNYWSHQEEVLARGIVQDLLAGPAVKLFQNGLYDLQYLWREGFRVANCTADTMLRHHALYPELPKGLGFLGSIYCNESAWKMMRKRPADEVVKKDE